MHRTAVVGWDGSRPADRAVDWAAEAVGGSGGRLTIAQIVNDVALYLDELDTKRQVALANFAVAERAARLRMAHPDLDVSTVVTRGEPSEALAARSGAESLLVVGGSYGSTEDYWYSSRMGEQVAAISEGPVAIIPIPDDRSRSGILVALDDPTDAEWLIGPAADLAERRGERVIAVHVHPDEGDADEPDSAALEEVVARIGSTHPGLTVDPIISAGPAATAILRLARDASHVVVGTRRPGVLRRLFLGSVSRTVVNNASCPTIVIPPPQTGVDRGDRRA